MQKSMRRRWRGKFSLNNYGKCIFSTIVEGSSSPFVGKTNDVGRRGEERSKIKRRHARNRLSSIELKMKFFLCMSVRHGLLMVSFHLLLFFKIFFPKLEQVYYFCFHSCALYVFTKWRNRILVLWQILILDHDNVSHGFVHTLWNFQLDNLLLVDNFLQGGTRTTSLYLGQNML